ncbi:MAG: site-2 protease family protein [Clostridia bacterium]|nr:site-2 protease family protein [Clostridia bacterium]
MQFSDIILNALAVIIILAIHEYSHALIACKLGDNTAKYMGRLTLNPLKHIDPFGALCMVLFRFGWAKPVPVNLRSLKKPKRDFAIIALAGPASNLILSFLTVPFYLLTLLLFNFLVGKFEIQNELLINILNYTLEFIFIFHAINLGIAIFNLIPIPPLDGSRIIASVLPTKAYIAYLKRERIFYYALLGWLLLGNIVSNFLLSIPIVHNSTILSILANIVSLSKILSYAIEFLSGIFFDFWELIPFLNI